MAREGSRWIDERPSGEDVAEWFGQQHIHDGLDHEHYIGGIVLIGAKEKVPTQRQKANGDTFIVEVERPTYTPYAKVDTRIAYFWDLVRALNGGKLLGEFIGVIEPVEQVRITDRQSPYYNEHLPRGFSMLPVKNSNESVNRYVVCTQRVAIYERESYARRARGEEPMPLLVGEDSKQTSLARNYADDNALMKARTGAIGRALGVAGILVLGTGVASAEDMQELQAAPPPQTAAAPASAALPPQGEHTEAQVAGGGVATAEMPAAEPSPEETVVLSPEDAEKQMRNHAMQLRNELSRHHPEAMGRYIAWYNERGYPPLSELHGPALRGAVIKLERDLVEAREDASKG